MAKRTIRQWEKKNGPTFYHAWANWEEGQFVEGVFMGGVLDKKYKRTNYKIKVEDFDITCERPDGKELQVGDVITINGTGGLARNLGVMEGDKTEDTNPSLISEGTAVRLVYEGIVEIEGGDWAGQEAHSVTVYMEKPGTTTNTDEEDYL